jgi:pyruvate-formate lyase-activating enzyme
VTVVVKGLVAGTVPFSAVDGPGNRFVVFLQGCGFDCLTCHNPAAIPRAPRGLPPTDVGDLLAQIRSAAPFLTGVTMSGGECTGQPDFVRALFEGLREDPATARLTRFLDSNGDADADVWDLLEPVTDAVMLDLKALDDEMHLVLAGASNARVLASIERLAAAGKLYEVRLLLVPGLNDDDETLRATAAWLRGIDPATRIRVIGFRPHGVRACAEGLLVATPEDMAHYRAVVSAPP